MDRFKFRAWHKTLNIMITEDNVSAIIDKYNCDERDEEGLFCLCERFPTSEILGIFDYFTDVIHSGVLEIMQCTGLKDYYGNLIYEGDIVSYDCDSELTAVVWADGAWYLKEIHGPWLLGIRERMEYADDLNIVGNIYENADLLEDTKKEASKCLKQ